MRKIPCAVEREFEGRGFTLTGKLTEGCEDDVAFGVPTRKRDGTATAIINGELYARYDAKRGAVPPEGAIPCQEPDPVTGHWPHWVKADRKEDKWIREAFENSSALVDGTYEACGPKIGSNHERLETHVLFRHGAEVLDVPDRSFDGLRVYLQSNRIEGIVFWRDGEPRNKVRRHDFGFEW